MKTYLRNISEYNQKWPDVDLDAIICWQLNNTGAGEGDSGVYQSNQISLHNNV